MKGIINIVRSRIFQTIIILVALSAGVHAADWEWMNPLPQGNTLFDVWGSSGNDVFAVGADGTILHYDGNSWRMMPTENWEKSSAHSNSLYGMGGISGTDVYAVGYGGTILYYDGDTWQESDHGITSERLTNIWGNTSDNIFAIGYNGKILRYNGIRWTAMISGTSEYLEDIWGNSGDNIFVVGGNGTILHYDGNNWTAMTSGTSDSLLGVWGSSANNVFVVGASGTILHYDGVAWKAMESGVSGYLYGVWGSSDSDVFAVGTGGTILHYDGTAWTEMTSGASNELRAIWGSSGDNVFVVGYNGRIFHYDGTGWTEMTTGPFDYFNGVWGNSLDNIFAVGSYGTIVYYDGSRWTEVASSISYLRGVWINSGSTFGAAAGYNGTILRYDGESWTEITRDVFDNFHDIWGSSENDIFAVGENGRIIHYDGINPPKEMESVTFNRLYGVWGSSGNNVFTVGVDGTIVHYDGNNWTEMLSGTSDDLLAVWGTGGDDIFATGTKGRILHYDGDNWTPMTSGASYSLNGIWGNSGNDVFAVSDHGGIFHYDGNVWTKMVSGSSNGLRAIWGYDGDVFAVGEWGTILHYPPSDTSILSVQPTSQEISKTTGTTTFTIENKGTIPMNWSLTEDEDWLSATPASGSLDPGSGTEITVNYDPNTGDDRTGSLTFEAPGAKNSPKTVEVIQQGDMVSVTITSPEEGSSVGELRNLMKIEGTASSSSGSVSKVELQITDGQYYLNAENQFTETEVWLTATGTTSWSYNISNVIWKSGTDYIIRARATNTAGSQGTESITIPSCKPSEITCELSVTNIILGEPLQISGAITPIPVTAATGVSIEIVSPSGQTLTIPALANSEGAFEYSVECSDIPYSGTWTVQTNWAGDENLCEATSQAHVLEVSKAKTLVNPDLTSLSIKSGETASVSGKLILQPYCGKILPDTRIRLDIFGPDGAEKSEEVLVDEQSGVFRLEDYSGFDSMGQWTVQVVFEENEAYQASASEIKVNVVESAGYAIIVQGKTSSEEGLASHNKTTNFVYETIKERGLLDDDIMYFNYNINQPGADAVPSETGIQEAITGWARDKMNAKAANLYIVMVDHGIRDTFYAAPDIISSQALSDWLNTLQAGLTTDDAKEQEIIVILGFCKSGSFIDDLSGDHRVIITSAAWDEASYKGPLDNDNIREGDYFTSEFFKAVSLGKSLRESFEEAAAATEMFASLVSGSSGNAPPYYDNSPQHPLLDDNGDRVGANRLSYPETDGVLSENVFIGVSTNAAGDVRLIRVAESQFLGSGENSVNLWAQADNETRVSDLWCEIKPPNYSPLNLWGSGQTEMSLTRITYTSKSQGGRFEWNDVGEFSEPGTYQLLFYAKDAVSGNLSSPMETKVYKDKPGNQRPDPFFLISPADTGETSTTPVLDWTETTDPDGYSLSYTVLISSVDFDDPSYNPEETIYKEGLKCSACLVKTSDGLSDGGDYYWKVRAIDEYGAFQESDTRIFHTNNYDNPADAWIGGHVYNPFTNQSVIAAVVNILAGGGAILNTLYTDSRGCYLGMVPEESETISVSGSGYKPFAWNLPRGEDSGKAYRSEELITADFPLDPTCTMPTGDINGTCEIDPGDAILTLQILAGETPSSKINTQAALDRVKPGLADVVYILRMLSDQR